MTDTNEVKVLVFDLDQTLVSTDLEKILNIVIPIYIFPVVRASVMGVHGNCFMMS